MWYLVVFCCFSSEFSADGWTGVGVRKDVIFCCGLWWLGGWWEGLGFGIGLSGGSVSGSRMVAAAAAAAAVGLFS